jgi:hypothetical protein
MSFKNYCALAVFTATALGVQQSRASAQQCEAPPYVPPCVQPPCNQVPPEAPPTSPPPLAPPTQPTAPPTAQFAAPTPSGQISGESNSMGVQGLSIHFPEFNLQFPTIQLPSLVRYRRQPEMQLDQARAPMIQGPTAPYGPLLTTTHLASPNPTAPPPEAPQNTPKPLETPRSVAPPPTAPQCVPPRMSSDPPPAPGVADARSNERLRYELSCARQELLEYRREVQQLQRSIEVIAASRLGNGAAASPPIAQVGDTAAAGAPREQAATPAVDGHVGPMVLDLDNWEYAGAQPERAGASQEQAASLPDQAAPAPSEVPQAGPLAPVDNTRATGRASVTDPAGDAPVASPSPPPKPSFFARIRGWFSRSN